MVDLSDEMVETAAGDAADPAPPLLQLRGVTTRFPLKGGGYANAVDDVSFTVERGEVVGIVGESGSGKSMTARSILQLVPEPGQIAGGEILLNGRDVLKMSHEQVRAMRGNDVAMIFQDPMTSLNPVLRVGDQIAESITAHRRLPTGIVSLTVQELLARMSIPEPAQRARSYPHEFSGGMRQRVMIAMGVANQPSLLIADEPTTALDVTVQAQIVELLKRLNREQGTAVILITHNMALVASLCTRVIVMYAGEIVEEGSVEQIFSDPEHPYTWSLLRSIPRVDQAKEKRLLSIKGSPPDLAHLPSGCRFHPRCPFAIERCTTDPPALEGLAPGHSVRCWVLMRNVADTSAEIAASTGETAPNEGE